MNSLGIHQIKNGLLTLQLFYLPENWYKREVRRMDQRRLVFIFLQFKTVMVMILNLPANINCSISRELKTVTDMTLERPSTTKQFYLPGNWYMGKLRPTHQGRIIMSLAQPSLKATMRFIKTPLLLFAKCYDCCEVLKLSSVPVI